MNFDTLLKEHVGVFGLFQILTLCILCIDEIFAAFHIMGSVFLAATPEHWCKNDQIASIPSLSNCSIDAILNMTVPLAKNGFDSCLMYKRNYSDLAGSSDLTCSSAAALFEELGNATESCSDWYYDTSNYGETVTTQWDFVCDKSWMKATISSVYIAGMGIGGIILGWFSDRFGRKKVILVSGMLNVVCSISTTFSPIPPVYYFFRFCHAGFLFGSTTSMFVLATEIVGPNWRVFVGATIFIVWALAYMGFAGIAYGLRFYNWKDMNLILILPELIYFILVFFFVPESPRWLYVQQRNEEADKIVRKMARVNKATLPKVLDIVEGKNTQTTTTTMIDLFKTPKIRIMTLILTLNWASNGFIYYGLSLNTSNLGGNPYINFLISGAVEIPAYIFQIWSMGRFGRIRPYCFSMLFGGVVLLVVMGIPEEQTGVIITLSMIGKFFISSTFGMIWTYSPEAYPTCIRNQGLMTSAIGARIASFLSPYIWLLAKINRVIPFMIYGAAAITAGVLFAFLPETLGRPLTQTVEEGEEACKKYRIPLRKMCIDTEELKAKADDAEEAELKQPIKEDEEQI